MRKNNPQNVRILRDFFFIFSIAFVEKIEYTSLHFSDIVL